jgi:hypothetical protein
MSSVAHSYRRGPNQLPDPAAENRKLRRTLQARDAEIERLRGALEQICHYSADHMGDLDQHRVWITARCALRGGGQER